MTTTLITGGQVVSPQGAAPADVLVDGETVSAVLAPGTASALGIQADRTIDASGKYVLPGGIDVHTHMDMPFGGTFSVDDFETGTRAAAWGGTTTIVDFPVQKKGGSLQEAVDLWHAKAEGKACIDYGFHAILADVNDMSLKEMDALVDQGVTSFKLFMAYPDVFLSTDDQIIQAMYRASDNGATIMMHAENGAAIDQIVTRAINAGHTEPKWHGLTRPIALEAEAVNRAAQMADVTGAPLYFVHLSSGAAVDVVTAARDAGRNVFGETCPQYLFLDESDLARPDFEGAKYVCTPALRPAEEQAKLWRGLRTNDLSVVATDHCPFCFATGKQLGKDDFRAIPNGIPGVEHRMDLLHMGVTKGEISLARWVEISAATPARMFGMYPKKGVIAPGSDADIVVYDPAATQTISAQTHHMNVDYSVYEGWEFTGKVETVLSRGEIVLHDGEFSGSPGRGQFVKRSLSQYLI
ncbi:dihydropyrimidinase [Flexivirga caeni]|uniref:Dihydropyrimidinase n=1 Tax=Flexivirga caeni TaxID=2294115 RepID=A0A3M9M752_9MICO|nr:dihydropyrimidinase [Flexivirga caeni]RNI21361.1 dihydropyrimidinase [Flexivirga caeni]